jgi:RHS repeat-associated protein
MCKSVVPENQEVTITKVVRVLDFHARMYDPSLGIFTSTDPMSSAMPSWSPYSYAFNNPIIFIDPTGMYPIYGANGEYLGDDGRSGNGDLAFTGEVTKRDKNGNATEFGSLSQFTTDHMGFLKAAGKLKNEITGKSKDEALWMAHAANNSKDQNETVIDQMNSGYSSAKGKLNIDDNTTGGKYAKAGLIDVLSGGADPTGGATHWDGFDFLEDAMGSNKFEEYSTITMHSKHFDEYQKSQQKYLKTSTNSYWSQRTPIGDWYHGWDNVGYKYFNVFSKSYMKNLESVGVKGATIFWKVKR